MFRRMTLPYRGSQRRGETFPVASALTLLVYVITYAFHLAIAGSFGLPKNILLPFVLFTPVIDYVLNWLIVGFTTGVWALPLPFPAPQPPTPQPEPVPITPTPPITPPVPPLTQSDAVVTIGSRLILAPGETRRVLVSGGVEGVTVSVEKR